MSSKVILVTGASSGIGKAAARQLVDEGHTVFGAARRVEEMHDIVSSGGHAIRLDVTDPENAAACVEHVVEEAGRIDVLISNAGYGCYGPVETTPVEDAKLQFDVNVWGSVRMFQNVLPVMRGQGSGRIVIVSSVLGLVTGHMGAWYCGSKYALESIADAMRLEVAQFGIDVALIEPGGFKTGFSNVAISYLDSNDGDNAYSEMYTRFLKSYRGKHDQTPSPEPVVDAIARAVNSESPEIRYLIGDDAIERMQKRRAMNDREFDDYLHERFNNA
ncbi:MAG: oxidoreductase [Planctomycetota bacterium]